ncbi:hypothetical protein DFQ28_004164 [Apophysomyces sp. BC1034]|nr:hypothetical protein DFQ30_003512 [Apophysomyces sp. BC1015]KAG0173286.1 hypothetical protein DFQ29_008034 [Apophysomyces sp. BC1021]KAG0188916.1 hypothetical protein DFQ28_004164 [Apophysomyces sp. BC1034]
MDNHQNTATSARRKSSSLESPTKRSSVGSLFSRTRTASLARLGKRPPTSSSTVTSTLYEDDEDGNDNGEGPDIKSPRLTSEYFKRYELMTEFINLRNPNHCPLGVYVMPSSDNLNLWYGTLFVHKGYYRSGVFKFRLTIPESYPNSPPAVAFLTDMFHPLVDVNGNVSISQQFPTWRPYQDYIFYVLHYLKNMFKKAVLDGLVDKHCLNKEAYRLYRTDTAIFGKLAQQCAQLSITESYLFDHFPDNNMIRFSPLSEAKFDELKAQILSSTTNSPDVTGSNENTIEQQLKDRFNDYKTTLSKSK